MPGPASCLFRNISDSCAGTGSEHVIPMCIGGTLESLEVLCANCNHYFGDHIDPMLCEHFDPIITTFGVLMRAQFGRRKIQATSLDGSLKLVQGAGGVTDLPKIYREQDSQGNLISVSAPLPQEDLLPEIVNREAPGKKFTTTRVPITDLLKEPRVRKKRKWTIELRRAVAKVLIEVVDEYARTDSAWHFRRATALDPILRFIRLGEGANLLEPTSPMVDLGAELHSAFDLHLPLAKATAEPSTCVAVIYDATKQRLFGLLSVARTMPLAVSLTHSNHCGDNSWSLLISRGLIPGPSSQTWVEDAVIEWRAVEWAEFSKKTREAILFAFQKYNESYDDAMGRAMVYVDQHDDGAITNTLREYRAARDGSCGAAVVETLRLRFRDNGISDRQWQAIRQRVEQENIGAGDDALLTVFRRELRTLLAEVGVPRGMVVQHSLQFSK